MYIKKVVKTCLIENVKYEIKNGNQQTWNWINMEKIKLKNIKKWKNEAKWLQRKTNKINLYKTITFCWWIYETSKWGRTVDKIKIMNINLHSSIRSFAVRMKIYKNIKH